MGQDFEARGRSAPSVATAAGVQAAAVYAFAFMLLLAGTNDAGLLARAMRAWIALVDPYLRWITFFGLVPAGGPDGHLAVMHRHLLSGCVIGVVVFVTWTRGYRPIWAQRLLVNLLRAHRTEAKLRRIGVSARWQAALGAFGAALLVLLPSGGTGVGWYFFLAPLASGTVSYCLTHFIILGRLADEGADKLSPNQANLACGDPMQRLKSHGILKATRAKRGSKSLNLSAPTRANTLDANAVWRRNGIQKPNRWAGRLVSSED